jgi:hypothetical protein
MKYEKMEKIENNPIEESKDKKVLIDFKKIGVEKRKGYSPCVSCGNYTISFMNMECSNCGVNNAYQGSKPIDSVRNDDYTYYPYGKKFVEHESIENVNEAKNYVSKIKVQCKNCKQFEVNLITRKCLNCGAYNQYTGDCKKAPESEATPESEDKKITTGVWKVENQPDYVPYQVCPICNGTGKILSHYERTTIDFETCDVCNGAKIIPMHKINK